MAGGDTPSLILRQVLVQRASVCRTYADCGGGYGAEVCPSSCTKTNRELKEVDVTDRNSDD
jgi:hypothetical protein